MEKSTIRGMKAVVYSALPRAMLSCPRNLLSILLGVFCIAVLATTHLSADERLSYTVTIIGIEGDAFGPVRSAYKASSLLEAKRSEPLISIANLRGHLKSDVRLLQQILRSEGYYNSQISERLKRRKNNFAIEISITPGALYVFDTIKVDYKDVPPDEEIRDKINKNLSLKKGAPARAEPVVIAEEQIFKVLPQYGFPFAVKLKRDLVVDHKNKTMNVTLFFDTGSRRKMGLTSVKGLTSIKEDYLNKFYTWSKGDYFNQKFIDDLRLRLMKTGLFSNIVIDIISEKNEWANIVITLTQAKHRTLGITTSYSTSEGIGGEISWEHRNLFNHGNRLKVTALASEIEQSLTTRFEIPTFYRLDQTLSIESAVRRQNTISYDATLVEARAGIDRLITPHLAIFGRGDFEYSDITDNQVQKHFFIASLPIGARWDNSDDLLDPSRGFRASISTAPSSSVGASHFSFLESEFRASAYYSLIGNKRMIVAARTRLGSIVGAKNDILPAPRRFFAGGGGSIRGFAFQRVGPFDIDDTPMGGRSVAEIALELRSKVSSTIGIVPFIEGGNVYENEFPRLSDFRWAVGLGARYHTSFAPVRVDIAFPLDRRAGESRMQFYISLGQAF